MCWIRLSVSIGNIIFVLHRLEWTKPRSWHTELIIRDSNDVSFIAFVLTSLCREHVLWKAVLCSHIYRCWFHTWVMEDSYAFPHVTLLKITKGSVCQSSKWWMCTNDLGKVESISCSFLNFNKKTSSSIANWTHTKSWQLQVVKDAFEFYRWIWNCHSI